MLSKGLKLVLVKVFGRAILDRIEHAFTLVREAERKVLVQVYDI